MGQTLPKGVQERYRKVIWAVYIYLGVRFIQLIRWKFRNLRNQAAAAFMIKQRNQKKYTFGPVDQSKAEIIKSADVTQLREHLLKETFTSVDLVNYYGARCQTIGREYGYSTEELFPSGMALAKKCDQERSEALKENRAHQLPFLHGIPISIKELFAMKGKLSTVGTAMLNYPRQIDSEGWTPLTDSGAIPIVRGNVPQAALSIHTTNYIWGTAENVYDRQRSCGGSSGGDGGLVSSRCVPIALGSDVGGSIRIPATFNGITGFKPTQSRISYRGAQDANLLEYTPNSAHFGAVGGPLAHSVNDCLEFFKIQCVENQHLRDPNTAPVPFNQAMLDSVHADHSKIKVGLLTELPFLPVSNAVKRAIALAKAALTKEGYQVVDVTFSPEDYAEGRNLLMGMVATGAGPGLIKDFNQSGEKLTLGVWTNCFLLSRGPVGFWFIRRLLSLIGMGRTSEVIQDCKIRNPERYGPFLKRKYEFQYAMSKKWQDLGLTAMVTPTFPHCSFKAQHADDMGLMLEYIFMWNTLHYPCGSIPVTTVQDDEQTFSDDWNDGWTKLLKQTAEGSAGMPISLQVVAHAYEDEKALAVMQSLDKQIQFRMRVPEV